MEYSGTFARAELAALTFGSQNLEIRGAAGTSPKEHTIRSEIQLAYVGLELGS